MWNGPGSERCGVDLALPGTGRFETAGMVILWAHVQLSRYFSNRSLIDHQPVEACGLYGFPKLREIHRF